jgi:proline iminopeptidase
MKTLYPEIKPFHNFYMDTGSLHKVYVEQSGNPAGIPVIFLHGGPCSGTRPDQRRFFNPALYHILLLDQRGCGLSLPFGELQGNTTPDLIADLENLRRLLRIEQYLLFGGSWGATLALLYAQQYPNQVCGMILRGVFLARQIDLDWFMGNGAHRIYPQYWQDLLDSLPIESQKNVTAGLYETVFGEDQNTAKKAGIQWQTWSAVTALGGQFPGIYEQESLSDKALQQVQMELHYAHNHYFISENQILLNCKTIQHIPTCIIHGQNDLTCPLESAWSLKQAMPQAQLRILPTAGHVAKGEEMLDALVSACDEMAIALSA